MTTRPNVLWLTLDSVRVDHTALGGYERRTTPRLADLAEAGIGFDTCIAHGKSTRTSSGAILTGLAPTRNTVGISGDVLPEEVRTVPERFRAAGYRTAGLSRNSFVSSATGLDRGFDRFQWLSSSTLHRLGPRTLVRYLLNLRRHSAGFSPDAAKHSTPYLMNDVAARWLDDFATEDRPFFFYLHYNEPHRPYYPPLPYLDRFTADLDLSAAEAAETAYRIHENLLEIVADGCQLTETEWGALTAMYDAEIAYTDEMVGRLVERVHRMDLGETVVVVTADHGELFGEHGLLSHRYVLDDAVTRVPLAVTGLSEDLAVSGDDLVQHWDVMETLLGIAGADTEGMAGHDLRTERPSFAISQRGPTDFERTLAHNPDYDTDRFHAGTLTAMRTERFRYQTSGSRSELFELPDETTDVTASNPEVAADMGDRLDAWLERHGKPIGEARAGAFDGAVKRQLQELGYLE